MLIGDFMNRLIARLVQYGIDKGLIMEDDRVYCTNQILDIVGRIEYIDETNLEPVEDVQALLDEMLDIMQAEGTLEEGMISRDLMDTRIMNVLTPIPSIVRKTFWDLYQEDPAKATDYFYNLCRDVNDIRVSRCNKDMRWVSDTAFDKMDISINLSKPEKDPKDIAKQATAATSSYPKCLLCKENEGYCGTRSHPARNNHRLIPLRLNDTDYFMQYSPYAYYSEHCIVFNAAHTPMQIDRKAFTCLLDFVEQFPHYFIGSNTDIPIVGGSILSHDHFQGGQYEFAMAKANVASWNKTKLSDAVEYGIVEWPMSVIRARSKDKKALIDYSETVLNTWIGYSDEACDIINFTGDTRHNAITPIARMRDGYFEMDLVLRNNRTNETYPDGIFHPHKEKHHIKKENIGLIEVMGLAVLPKRLLQEMELLKPYVVAKNTDFKEAELDKHKDWIVDLLARRDDITEENVLSVLQDEIGAIFSRVLEDAGVYKRDEAGKAGFNRFIETLEK